MGISSSSSAIIKIKEGKRYASALLFESFTSPQTCAISGANWAILPPKIGAIAPSMRAHALVVAAILAAKLAAKTRAETLMPLHAKAAKMPLKLAYGATGMSDKAHHEMDEFNKEYIEKHDGGFEPVWKIDRDYDHGPKSPFSIFV
jgi:hypothetical protein